ncbi:protein-L-isoaspartate(D-aspartate) O-methyltransferase [Solirubrobacter sp. CPCC 204708]|uniref:Protein-L-isoaspartate O-methyltransferase n=1 Tax=Solirubrobacter deserti TaxID=2282478 RepID=A0ABT4RR22_9ACTN|nr:protein-L-isoaspartate(D-aspartate) O-methyltransferase [Solirubrobacter deserti]MBE2320479.1 protein-L-isoaspartate(D-aspartate) O-methyltransferase [Solirubrobacter deserti]MDA0140725.1 protein-L-isoaspartate(D-aspartate) O-methyltransferase [Solirubrobacter deserti]
MRRGRDRLLTQLRPHVSDERVLQAVHDVPRDRFVPARLASDAWDNVPLPIGSDQTISQPLIVARMCELLALRGGERILDVGTGSGYHAAILARLGAHVWSVERHPALSERAAQNLAAAGIDNVTLLVGDGSQGLPAEAPFDAINVAAAASTVPLALEAQLVEGGRLVVPVQEDEQRLVLIRRTADGFERRSLERVRFVPLVS